MLGVGAAEEEAAEETKVDGTGAAEVGAEVAGTTHSPVTVRVVASVTVTAVGAHFWFSQVVRVTTVDSGQ